ncbi:hypothetical protein [Vibrio nigripulchritudo]|uniref:hypothetical protein n=1 Tax=Vibrio nigripulchritudo TaxID=28173 RepID=UPI002491BEDC|nr:hypothetical protein [Vibrio nigripulchritudo]BDU38714.1 hypothetical protein TUMSATVNIG2_31830 [Vibrio nigripulchritudo]BDU44434.1 hypothetical protein TUMSATVNIG3_32320 [Vibrio nigripulchritudo]
MKKTILGLAITLFSASAFTQTTQQWLGEFIVKSVADYHDAQTGFPVLEITVEAVSGEMTTGCPAADSTGVFYHTHSNTDRVIEINENWARLAQEALTSDKRVYLLGETSKCTEKGLGLHGVKVVRW